MRQDGYGLRKRGLDRHHVMDVFLRIAAYRATHRGGNPPPNSRLWADHLHLWEESHRPSFWARIFRSRRAEPDWGQVSPMVIYPMEISFLGEDFSVEGVQAKLLAWPMIGGFRLIEGDAAGEWFTCRIDVTAESRFHARRIVEWIFLLRPELERPEIESF